MKEYQVTIREALEKTVTVEASSAIEARNLVEQQWKNGDHILDADHFQGVVFKTPPRLERER